MFRAVPEFGDKPRRPRICVKIRAHALGNQAGATAAIPGVLRSGKTGIKILTSIFNRVYKGNIEILTAWETASHVERTRSPKTTPASPTPVIP